MIRGAGESRNCGGGCRDATLCVVGVRCCTFTRCDEATAGIWTICCSSSHICLCYDGWMLAGQRCGTDAVRSLSKARLCANNI